MTFKRIKTDRVADIQQELKQIRDDLRLLQELLRNTRTRPVEEYLTVQETARLVNRAPFTVRAWARTGRIEARRIGGAAGGQGHYRIHVDEIGRIKQFGLRPPQDLAKLKQLPRLTHTPKTNHL